MLINHSDLLLVSRDIDKSDACGLLHNRHGEGVVDEDACDNTIGESDHQGFTADGA